MKPYKFIFFHREKINDGTLISKDIYRFITRFNRVYFIEIEKYENHLYAAKFYLRIHKNLKNRYNLIINDGDGFRILSTLIATAKKIEEDDSFASFCFIGEPKLGEDKYCSQRYRVYQNIAYRDFSPTKYQHVKDDENSIFFILNNLNSKMNIELINIQINEYYEIN